MKKILLFLMIIFLSVGLIACTNEKKDNEENTDDVVQDDTNEAVTEKKELNVEDVSKEEISKNSAETEEKAKDVDTGNTKENTSSTSEKKSSTNVEGNSKTEVNTKTNNSQTTNKQQTVNKGDLKKMATLNQLIEKDMALYAENPLTKEHIASIKLQNLSSEYKAKAYYLTVDGKDYKFEVNEVDSSFHTVVIDPQVASAKEVQNAEIKIQK